MRALAAALAVFAAALAGGGCERHLVGPRVDISKCSPIAIVEFKSKAAYDRDLGDKLADAVLADIYQNRNAYRDEAARSQVDVSWTPPALEFVERAQLAGVIQEQDLGATDRVDAASAPKIGAVSGARAVLFGIVEDFSIAAHAPEPTSFNDATRGREYRAEQRGFMRVSFRVVDAANARILHVAAATAAVEDSCDFYPDAGGQPTLRAYDEVKSELIRDVARKVAVDFYYRFSY